MIEFYCKRLNQSIRMKATGYQFPYENESYYDDNWLNFEIEIQKNEQHFKIKDPLFLTWECIELAKWFQNFDSHTLNTDIMNLENTFCFSRINKTNEEKSNLIIRIHRTLVPYLTIAVEEEFYFCLDNSDSQKVFLGFKNISNEFPIR